MSDFEDNRAPIGNDRARLHSPSSHLAETAVSPHISNSDPHRPPENGSRAGRSDVVNVPVSHWPPENGSSVGRTENETDRLPDANPSARYGVSFQAYGGQGSMYPYPYGYPMPFYGHPTMFGPQPMSGMAGVGFAPMAQHSQPGGGTYHQTSTCAGPESGAGTSSSTGHKKSYTRSEKRVTHSLPRAYDVSPQRERRRSLSRATRRKGRRSPSRESSISPQRRGRGSSLSSQSRSPSPRRSFVQRMRKRRSRSSSPARSMESGEEEQELVEEEEEFSSLSFSDCVSLVQRIRPDLVSTSSKSDMKALSAGERSVFKRKTKDDVLCFEQSALVSETLCNLQTKIRSEEKTPSNDQPADLPHSALKIGELLPASPFLASRRRGNRGSFIAEGVLPSQKLAPSSSDLSARSNPSSFKPHLKEKGLVSLEESALRGLQSLSITDSLFGIVADCLDESQTLESEYTRRPSKQELLQLIHFACKCLNYAVDATARCYLNTVLIRRDSFLSSADKLPQDYDKSALRSLPISAPALIGPQVAHNVEKWEKRQFDRSVRSIVSKADKVERSPRKRARSASDQHSASGSKRFNSSASRSSSFSQRKSSRGRFVPKNGKSKPKASAHPQ